MEKTSGDFSSTASWSAGWYLFEDGKVIGPLTADEAFSREMESSAGVQRMVSRKGFAQWYPLKDFAELHTLAGKYAHQIASESPSKPSLPTGSSSLSDMQPRAKVIGPDTQTIATKAMSDSAATIERARSEVVAKVPSSVGAPSRKERKRLRQEEKRAKKLFLAEQRQQRVQNEPPVPTATMNSMTFEARYLLVASRLRLGKVRNSWLAAFVLTPLTLLGYWASWLGRANEEVMWHVTGSSRIHFPLPLWFSFIPGVHLIFAWKLASMISQMERQNGYNTVSPVAATLLALLPPLYIHHIQSALNRHWRLHVANSSR